MSISLDEAVELTRTGDVWVFRGRSVPDRAIQFTTNSPVNHVGMAVVLDDMPPLMWHAELGRSLPDLWSGTHQRGVQLHDLRDAVCVWANRYGQRAWLRQLDPPAAGEMERAVLRTVARLDGTPFPSTAQLAWRWVRGRVPSLPGPGRAALRAVSRAAQAAWANPAASGDPTTGADPTASGAPTTGADPSAPVASGSPTTGAGPASSGAPTTGAGSASSGAPTTGAGPTGPGSRTGRVNSAASGNPAGPGAPAAPVSAAARERALETAYCAEVVAVTYEAMGLLPAGKRPNWYDPGRFWSGDDLGLTGGARLGAEIEVRVPPR
ncbi:conserved hypothetical protein [Micromonospora lupini str. Lupac 08]|uniref:Guanylate cyclase n=1 Tax=Micromonospora lupini str. Lupac 08 TaxID=1150864 RepID=I0L876_9ACTN|nr:conserved hypothetical protein [Micromonospora lupini str. Lupac 08]